ncbi:hypothetical protein [Pseudaminobacter soli (ex Li et al. 2025)]|uniref:Uncharacterized protein n=1 Tax=Pseudaminobacter soli (ex Li et al. 2025) TaxID=1295366 RepID=A0A2P7S019_9HYPH|nr:hypothetical protein [Mesorhizobium soli]PSJ55794.1 hypothetical protein C7I85_26260 [Mesorhizobium soli]
MNVLPMGTDKFQVADDSGHFVAGPFDTNSQAWQFIDGLTDEDRALRKKPRPLPRTKTKTSIKTKSKSKTVGKPSRKAVKQMKRAAAKAPGWVRKIAAAHYDPLATRAYQDSKFGKLGGASPVRRIDPAEYLAEKAQSK